ncbi:CoA transferase [Pseudonocardia sp. ICBG162]|uniref:CoA transferase n=1 Tax=Pseudonocardia sp. ICBG162 TaxID=2846761 RepID=UPI001CF6DF43|nr:CoA transferase [Pseudonocardia sp. ICBG162]
MGAWEDWTASGVVALTGHPDGPALVPPGSAATVAAALGWPFGVDGAALLGERAALSGRGRAGRTAVGGASRLLRTADGWAAVSCARPDDPVLLGAVVEQVLPDDDPWPVVTAALAAMPGRELAERAELIGVPAAPLSTPGGTAAPTVSDDVDLRGRLVVSFAALWAGPLCAQLLGRAGAHVVTVETPQRPDGARRGDPRFYALLHHGEQQVVLDPDRDRAALHALVAAADVVIEASRPRALRGFGLSAEQEVARGATWVSITAAGRSSDRVGFGDDVAAAAGLVARDADGAPVFVGDAIADPLTGLTAAALAASEPGVLHDVSMTAVVAGTLDGTVGGPSAEAPRPRHRPVPDPAPGGGRGTAAVLARLGIRP